MLLTAQCIRRLSAVRETGHTAELWANLHPVCWDHGSHSRSARAVALQVAVHCLVPCTTQFAHWPDGTAYATNLRYFRLCSEMCTNCHGASEKPQSASAHLKQCR